MELALKKRRAVKNRKEKNPPQVGSSKAFGLNRIQVVDSMNCVTKKVKK